MIAVVAAEEAPRGPGGGLGDGDAHVQAVEHAARAQHVGDPVGQRALGVGVEGADERQPRASRRAIQLSTRRDRLVDVDDVVAAGAQLACCSVATPCGVIERFETAPLAGKPTVRPSGTR